MDFNPILVEGCGCVSNAVVYGLSSSIVRAKYPKSVNIETLNDIVTTGISSLGTSDRGAGHDNFLNGIVVQFDLKFTNKAWVEAERYHFFDFISSQSTMHKITCFDLDKAYIKYVDARIVEIMKEKVKLYNSMVEMHDTESDTVKKMKISHDLKEMYLEILYSNPAGFQLTAGMTTNYRQLKTIYSQRKNHKLPEWREFCAWIETLPHSEFITC